MGAELATGLPVGLVVDSSNFRVAVRLVSWFPTHFTKNVKWMGHGSLQQKRKCSSGGGRVRAGVRDRARSWIGPVRGRGA